LTHPTRPTPVNRMTRMTRTLTLALLLAFLGRASAADKPSVKVDDTPPPNELSAAVRGLLDAKAMTVSDDKGKLIGTFWPRKSLESKATAEQVQAGLKYTNLEETTLVGAVSFPDGFTDYRKQKVKPGAYTLRLGIQPMDGDHMGTAPYNEFCLLGPADKDTKPETMDPKELHELSTGTTTRKHPGIVLLFPNPKPADAPSIEAKPQDHWVLNFRIPVSAAGQKTALGFSLVVVGHSMSE
jgi:hypothetical protein